ncbi:MAG: hypothetical protein AVDCRST_MAG45-1061 [uncultured Solirubrobacterales bacterium]|uniref:Uncharacterized protein n=1 Tax=uncultured Solirubrobacterales bacterium TaxID=768556 RepID=A0A6J4SN41_9ACTN|nr:MAG: hypothetical protein AVDCRST_MAG45-1061 [uncultured Solirubrobacterales bacterium]
MPIVSLGPLCHRRSCRGPAWRDDLCPDCWRLARLFGKDPRLFAYQPRDGWRDERDAAELPWEQWEQWEQQASADGRGVADLFASERDGGRGPDDAP